MMRRLLTWCASFRTHPDPQERVMSEPRKVMARGVPIDMPPSEMH
jgi:hypothetical protein